VEGNAIKIRLIRVIIHSIGDVELAGELVLMQRARHPLTIDSRRDFGRWFGGLARLLPNNRG